MDPGLGSYTVDLTLDDVAFVSDGVDGSTVAGDSGTGDRTSASDAARD